MALNSDGVSFKDHLLAVEKITKKKPKELLDLVELPDSFRECWNWFINLNNSRSSGFGMGAITYTEMYSYFNLMQIEVSPEEIEVIKMFDLIAMKSYNEQQEQNKVKNKK